jgi:lipopolysaccharide biosynthesis glycosyltransferase
VRPYGLNSGIIYMNLDKMRQFGFELKITDLLDEYKPKLAHPEQDLMSILFSFYPSKLACYNEMEQRAPT